jgi:hypothetical protein
MRIGHRYLTWDSHLKIIKPMRAILDKHNISYKYKEDLNSAIPSSKYLIEFNLYEDNPNFSKVKGEIDKYGIEPQTGTYYEKTDIDKAEWFIASTGSYQYPQPENDFGYLKVTFNLECYCPLCGIGKVQNAPYRLTTEPKQFNNQFWGLHWEFDPIFIRQETKDILEKEKFTGVTFSQPVLHKKNTAIKNFYQLHIDTMLDKGFNSYNTRMISCKVNNEEGFNADSSLTYCGQIKYHHPRIGGYLFDKTVFNSDLDIVQSREYFGSGRSANRLQIVSKRFKQLVDNYKLKGLSFTPIVHEKLNR